jgi:hypothetical protein
MNKILFSTLTLVGLVGLAARAESGVTRAFMVDWSKPATEANDVQQCDDSYFSHLELHFPRSLPKAELKKALSGCPDLRIERIDEISFDDRGYQRVRLKGGWGCEMKFEKPLTSRDREKSTFTLYLSDAC